MSSKTAIIKKQRDWALKAGLNPSSNGYLRDFNLNLFKPMSEQTKKAFDKGSGSELNDSPGHPAKMRAVHSSSTLAVNVFDPWVGSDAGPLDLALNLSPGTTDIRFEKKYPTGLPGIPPNLDVVLFRGNEACIAIESKFTEWLTPKLTGKPSFAKSYFPSDKGLWDKAGLPETQRLADSIYSEENSFRRLDVPQLIKHALGLATQLGSKFRLFYVYYDWPCDEAKEHNMEIAAFSERIHEELGFQAMSYQELFSSLSRSVDVPAGYIAYLRSRYFS